MAKRTIFKKGLLTAGNLARYNLEKIGAMLDNLNAKAGKPTQYTAVDLSGLNNHTIQDSFFRQQTLEASQQIFGQRFARYGKYAKKVVPDSMFDQVTDKAFIQLAQFADRWSQIELSGDERTANISTLDDQQRHGLAIDIANQNRALATLGGITGMAGLPGLLADTLWLLLISLRTIYQLAAIHDKPLTGKQGAKIAYDILANANLSKMQEKQAILAALGVAKGFVNNVDHYDGNQQIHNLSDNPNVQYYIDEVNKLAEQFNIDLDSVHLVWLDRLLPISATAVGMYYNSHLIDEVIGVTQATFGPKPKLAKHFIDNKSQQTADIATDSQQDTDTNTDNDNQQAQPNTDNNDSSQEVHIDKQTNEQTDEQQNEDTTQNTTSTDNSH